MGHFGLVSFGGSNLAASVVNFLDDQLVRELPPEDRSLARKILRQRRQRGWETMRLDSDPVEHFRQGSDNLFRIARDVAKVESLRAARQAGADVVEPEISINVDVDRRLTYLATQIIRRRPILYLNWVRQASLYGMDQLFDYAWIFGTFLLLLLSLPIAWARGSVPIGVSRGQRTTFPGSRAADLTMLTVLAVGYFVVYLLLVSLVYFPFDRYFVSLTLFLPSALAAGLFEIWRGIARPRGWKER